VRCYISVCGLRVGSMSDGGTSYSCVQTVLIPDEIVGGNPALCFRYALLQQVFESVDGAGISQSDRSRLQLDDSALTYSEIEIASFGDLLSTADARDGQVFYDLGCGVGKAVATAVMSETHFVRVVGIELLPTLCQTALTALQELKSKLLDRSSYYEDTSIISASSAFEIRLAHSQDVIRYCVKLSCSQ
jgi:SAM-dependent methyltransferase